MSDALLQAMILANPRLSRFDPLSRIIFFDDFDTGLNGWTKTVGNYEGSLDTMLPQYKTYRPPMLSNLTSWDTGTTGSMEGTYAMKISTFPKAGAISNAMKRLTWRFAGAARVEYYFTFKPEASELRLLDTDVRCVGFGFDLQQGDRHPDPYRVLPHFRYLNSNNGKRVNRWQFKHALHDVANIGAGKETKSFFHLGPEDWEDLPGAEQRLCYNETATKFNWHYVRLDLDLDRMTCKSLRCNDREFDLSNAPSMKLKAMPNLWCMFQPYVWVEADADKRAFLYLDSALLSVERM